MFSECKSLNNIKFSNFNASKIESFSGMFEECENLTSIDLSNFNTINASDMSYMFRGCKSLNNIKFSNFNTSLRTIRGMFNGCASLISIDLYNLNLPNNKDTPEIRESNTLFQLFVNVANWKTCGIDIDDVFMGCESLKCLYCFYKENNKFNLKHCYFLISDGIYYIIKLSFFIKIKRLIII